jgi:hypothetical protein
MGRNVKRKRWEMPRLEAPAPHDLLQCGDWLGCLDCQDELARRQGALFVNAPRRAA